jgi:hypothetical protein
MVRLRRHPLNYPIFDLFPHPSLIMGMEIGKKSKPPLAQRNLHLVLPAHPGASRLFSIFSCLR